MARLRLIDPPLRERFFVPLSVGCLVPSEEPCLPACLPMILLLPVPASGGGWGASDLSEPRAPPSVQMRRGWRSAPAPGVAPSWVMMFQWASGYGTAMVVGGTLLQVDTPPPAPRQQVRTGCSLCHTEGLTCSSGACSRRERQEGRPRAQAPSRGGGGGAPQWPGFLDGFRGTGDGHFGEWLQAEGGTADCAVPLPVGCYSKTEGELCGQAELSPRGWRLRQAACCTPQMSPRLLVPLRPLPVPGGSPGFGFPRALGRL